MRNKIDTKRNLPERNKAKRNPNLPKQNHYETYRNKIYKIKSNKIKSKLKCYWYIIFQVI